jgi:hypothetical protein
VLVVVLLLLNLGMAQPLEFLLLSLRLSVCAVFICYYPIGLLRGPIKYIETKKHEPAGRIVVDVIM